jgi:membrane-bound lytic murein transglycosylase D
MDSEMSQKKESTSKEEKQEGHPPKKTNKKSKNYSVKNGDTLSEIAEKFHISVTQLKKANGLKNDLIRPGQKIIIPLK